VSNARKGVCDELIQLRATRQKSQIGTTDQKATCSNHVGCTKRNLVSDGVFLFYPCTLNGVKSGFVCETCAKCKMLFLRVFGVD